MVQGLERLLIPPTLPRSSPRLIYHLTQRVSQLKDYCRAAKIAFKFIHEGLIPVVDNCKPHANLLGLIQGPSNLNTIAQSHTPAATLTGSMLRASEIGLDNASSSFQLQAGLFASQLRASYAGAAEPPNLSSGGVSPERQTQTPQPLSLYTGGLLSSQPFGRSVASVNSANQNGNAQWALDPQGCLYRLDADLLAGLQGHAGIVLLGKGATRDVPTRAGFIKITPSEILEGVRRMLYAADRLWAAGKSGESSKTSSWFKPPKSRSQTTQDGASIKKFQIESQMREKYPEMLQSLVNLEKDTALIVNMAASAADKPGEDELFEIRIKGKMTAVTLAKILSCCGTEKQLDQTLPETGSTISFLRTQDPMACPEEQRVLKSNKSLQLSLSPTTVHRQVADIHVTRLARGILLAVWLPAHKNKMLHTSILRGYIERLIVGLGAAY